MRLKQVLEEARQSGVHGARQTPYGTLYEPKSIAIQIALLIGGFVGGPAVGWILGLIVQGLSPTGKLLICIPPTLVFFLGYGLWSARLAAIVFDMIGKSILRALFHIIVRRRKPVGVEDVLPDRAKLEQMAVKAQKAAWSFVIIAVLIGPISGLLLLLFSAGILASAAVGSSCLLWGYLLGVLGRRGFLPLPQAQE